MDYGSLAQVSVGILKEKKCLVYFLDYKFIPGSTRMKLLEDLPPPRAYITDKGQTYPSHICIPLPTGPDALIKTHDVATASKMLGVHFSPASNTSTHINHMVQKGLDWVDCLQTKLVSCSNAWLSFYFQLFPTILWGLVTVFMQPSKLDKKLQRVYGRALPFLGINFKIKREWRTLPEMYQGLSLPNFSLVALAEKVFFLLRN
jgi:hypothetical protein